MPENSILEHTTFGAEIGPQKRSFGVSETGHFGSPKRGQRGSLETNNAKGNPLSVLNSIYQNTRFGDIIRGALVSQSGLLEKEMRRVIHFQF